MQKLQGPTKGNVIFSVSKSQRPVAEHKEPKPRSTERANCIKGDARLQLQYTLGMLPGLGECM